MYQRYYKQKKFGRIFSFCMVIGSGLSYYVKTSIKSVKSLFKIENLSKYSEYFPANMKNVIENIKEYEKGDAYSKIKNGFNDFSGDNIFTSGKFREDKFSLKNKFWIYKNNLDRSHCDLFEENSNKMKNRIYSSKISTKDELKYKETYKLYRYIKNFSYHNRYK